MQPAQTNNKKTNTKNAVVIFMDTHHLQQYTPVLISLGYDDLVVLKALCKTELENIAKNVKMKPGHAAKFIWALTQSAPATPATDGAAAADTEATTAKKTATKIADAASPTCPAGHALEMFHTPLLSLKSLFRFGSSFTCNACSKNIAKNTPAHRCSDCDYHMCRSCFTNKCDGGKPDGGKPDGGAYVAMVVDRSGSMSSMGNEVMNGFNSFLAEQKALPGKCTATVVRFDNVVEVLHHGVPLQAVQAANSSTFSPRGMTALLDAMGQTIQMVETKVKGMPQKPNKIMVMILTDGAENGSQNFTRATVMANIKRLEATGDWQFVFVGANQDAIAVGASYGMSAQNCLSYDATPMTQQETFKCMSANVATYRGACKSSYRGFSSSQRAATKLGLF